MPPFEMPTQREERHACGDKVVVLEHPAFCQIAASRVTGKTFLYGSDFQHHDYITVTIRESRVDRHLNNDWYHADKQVLQIAMSEAQWATFISSMNMGEGTPCTLGYVRDVGELPRIAGSVDRKNQFQGEFGKLFEDAKQRIQVLKACLNEAGITKKLRDNLQTQIDMIQRDIDSSVRFVAKQFDEHMEKTVEAAKVEVNAYAASTLMKAGITALAVEDASPVCIEYHTEDQNGI